VNANCHPPRGARAPAIRNTLTKISVTASHLAGPWLLDWPSARAGLIQRRDLAGTPTRV